MGNCLFIPCLSNNKSNENEVPDASSSPTPSAPTTAQDTMPLTAHTKTPSLAAASTSSVPASPTTMTSTASTTLVPRTARSSHHRKYDVFISHAGEDKATIALPLREKLLEHRIAAFVDEADIAVGTKDSKAMESAMETAKIGVIVLSPEFVVRKWPIKELMCFLRRLEESGGGDCEEPVVIPFFYRLKIDDLYLEPRLDRLDKDGKRLCDKSRFFERMKNGEPEADIQAIEASLRKVRKIMGVRNDFDASNDSAHIMYRRREVLLQELCVKIHQALGKDNLSLNGDVKNVTTEELFHAYFDRTQDTSDLVFDFSYLDEDKNACSQEAKLLTTVLEQTENTSIGVQGISGVGKSSVMRGISCLDIVKTHFQDGVYSLSLGKDGTTRDLIEELSKAVKKSGGRQIAEALRREEKIENAIEKFRSWFARRKCLFIVDDVWQTRDIPASIIHELLRLGVSGEESKVMLTTRSPDIASWADNYFELQPLGAIDFESRRILVRYSRMKSQDEQDETAVNEILERCSGLPLFLAIAGKAVRTLRLPRGHEEQAAYQVYARRLRGNVQSMLTTGVALYERLDSRLMISLNLLEERKNDFRLEVRLSMKEIHRRLSVLRKQSRVPMTMLRFLWEVENESQAALIAGEIENVGLANLEIEKRESEYCELLRLHDSLYEFAVMETRKHDEERTGHEALLRGYGCGLTMKDGCHNWWDLPTERDDYIDANLCRHLLGAGRSVELAYLLLSPEWTVRQVKKNGILYLEADFSLGITAAQDLKKDMSEEEICEVKEAIQLISQAVTLSSGFVASNIVEMPFQLHGRLKRFCENNRAIRAYCSWFEREPERPLILCETSFLGEPGTANTRIVFVGSPVCCMITLNDGERFACGCGNGQLAIVNVRRSEVEKEWHVHDEDHIVSAIAITKDETQLISCSFKATKLWKVETGECVRSFTDHTEYITGVAVMNDGRRVISVSRDCTARMLDLETGQILSKPFTIHDDRGISCIAVLGTEEDVVVTGGSDGRLRMWNVRTGAQVGCSFDGHDNEVRCVAVTPDCRYVVSGSMDTVRVWDVGSHQQIGKSLKGHTDCILCLAVSGDGNRLVSGSGDETIRVWDLESQTEICDPLEGHGAAITGILFPGGVNDHIVSCSEDGTVRVWDLTLRTLKKLRNHHETGVSGISFTPEGRHVVSGSWDETLRVWDTSTGEQVGGALKRHSGVVRDVCVTPNGRYIVSVSGDKTVCLWNLKSRQVMCTLTGHTGPIKCVAVTPQSDRVVTGSLDKTVRIWDLGAMDGSHITLDGHQCGLIRVFVSDDDLRVVSVDEENNIFVWELETKNVARKFREEYAQYRSRREVLDIIGESTMDDDNTLSILLRRPEILYGEGAKQTVLATMDSSIYCWALSPDQKRICVGLLDGQVAFMKLETNEVE